jgi:hypothetical protein
MIVYHSDANKYAVACSNIDAWYELVKDHLVVVAATEAQLMKLCAEHKKGNIEIEKVKFKDLELYVDKDGRMNEWPEGFFDNSEKLLGYLCFGDKL